MAHNGKRCTDEIKRQIIDLYLAGKPIAQLAEEYGLVEQTIYKWKRHYAPSIEVDENQSVSLKDYRELQKKCSNLKLRTKYQ
jgi:transposase